MIAKIILFMSIVVGSGILSANVYTSVVDAKSWGSNIPESLQTARTYFQSGTPARFFRAVSPLNQVLAVLALILFWRSVPSSRMYLGIAMGCYIATDVFTFAYFYPRNDIMFVSGTDTGLMTKAWSEWNTMNWVRSVVILVGICASCVSLDMIYSKR